MGENSGNYARRTAGPAASSLNPADLLVHGGGADLLVHVAAGFCLGGGGPNHAVFGHFGSGGGAAVDFGVQ